MGLRLACLLTLLSLTCARAAEVVFSSAAPRALSEAEAEQRLSELLDALASGSYRLQPPPERNHSEWLAQLDYKPPEKPWYTMTLTRRQWLRWQRKAEAWRGDAHLRFIYKDDLERFSGKIGGREIAAIVDILTVHIHNHYPSPVTGGLISLAKIWEKLSKELPVEFRDDVGAYASDYLRPDRHGIQDYEDYTSEGPILDREELYDLSERRYSEEGGGPGFLSGLQPRLKLKAKPRVKLGEAGAKLGAGFSMRLGEHCRFKLDGDYDTRDQDWACTGGFLILLGKDSPPRPRDARAGNILP